MRFCNRWCQHQSVCSSTTARRIVCAQALQAMPSMQVCIILLYQVATARSAPTGGLTVSDPVQCAGHHIFPRARNATAEQLPAEVAHSLHRHWPRLVHHSRPARVTRFSVHSWSSSMPGAHQRTLQQQRPSCRCWKAWRTLAPPSALTTSPSARTGCAKRALQGMVTKLQGRALTKHVSSRWRAR